MIHCPDEPTWDRFLLGVLPAAEQAAARHHVSSCAACQAREREARDDSTLLAEVRQLTLSPVRTDLPNLLPREIAGMRVVRFVGEGATSIVYEVEQPEPKRTIAIKLLKNWRGASERRRAMFTREAEALARLSHPGIAAIFFSGRTAEGQPFVAVELARGVPLDRFAESIGRDPRRLTALAAELADALHSAHQRNVIHRDVKPANILVAPDGAAKFVDFGLARVSGDGIHGTTIYAEGVGILGTLPYMAPEQVRGDPREIDHRCDVYALGAALYDAISGRPPHLLAGLTVAEAGMRVCMTDSLPLDQLCPAVPPALAQVVQRALARTASERFASAHDLALALRGSLAHADSMARGDRPALPPQRAAWIAGIALVAGASSIALFSGDTRRAPAQRTISDTPPTIEATSDPSNYVGDLRTDGPPPPEARNVRFISTYLYVVGDTHVAWRNEQRSLSLDVNQDLFEASAKILSADQLLLAAQVAEAAEDWPSARRIYNLCSEGRGRYRFLARAGFARILSRTEGCSAAADSILRLERASGVDKGNNSAFASEALLTAADHWLRCGDRDRAQDALRRARDAYDALPNDYPKRWFDSEFARMNKAISPGG